ncbi:MAG TPA: hypothetical protein VM142_05805 [Acidimicrobiales bacterium]|nr:hypothetical protein [Acidimicrobiales bacterium]
MGHQGQAEVDGGRSDPPIGIVIALGQAVARAFAGDPQLHIGTQESGTGPCDLGPVDVLLRPLEPSTSPGESPQQAIRMRKSWHDGGVPRNFHLERYPGMYVAIDMASDEVVLTASTPEELHEQIKVTGLRNVAVMRAPREDEPLFVGMN